MNDALPLLSEEEAGMKLTPGEAHDLFEFANAHGGEARIMEPTSVDPTWGVELKSGNKRHTVVSREEAARFYQLYAQEAERLLTAP